MVKHVGRVRVPKDITEESDESPLTANGATIKKIAPRESIVPNSGVDESMMEMSIREVREIKKPTTVLRR